MMYMIKDAVIRILCAISAGIIVAFITWMCDAAYRGYMADYIWLFMVFLMTNISPLFVAFAFCLYTLFIAACDSE